MRKSSARSFLFSLLLVFAAMLLGCGGPKFEGVWVLDSQWTLTKEPTVHELTIEKNGKSYILNELVYSYDVSKKWVNENEQPFAKADLAIWEFRRPTEAEIEADKALGESYHPIYNFECRLVKVKSIDNRAATLNDNKLTLDGSLGAPTFTYLDGDDTINYKGQVYTRAKGSSLGDKLNDLKDKVKSSISDKVAKEPQMKGLYKTSLETKSESRYMRLGTAKVGEIVFTD